MAEGEQAKRKMQAAVAAAMDAMTNDLLGRAQREAPVEEGTLRGSGEANVEVTPTRITGEVSFSTVYAARQHEEVTWKHEKGGKAKYLEDPLKAMAPRYLSALAAAMR